MTEQQAQNIIAFLELARTAIDNAQLRVAGFPDGRTTNTSLVIAMSEIHAASRNLVSAVEVISEYASSLREKPKDASAVDGVAARESVSAKQKG